jgi:polyvinyl alcohol dehydrogenase (cytochrome)
VTAILLTIPPLVVAQDGPATRPASHEEQMGRPGYPPRPYAKNREGYGSGLFGDYCAVCHGNPAEPRAPSPDIIRQMSPETIYEALTTGAMKEMAKDLGDDDRRGIAEYMSGRRLGDSKGADAQVMPNRCSSNPPLKARVHAPGWDGWSPQLNNTRFQKADAAGLTAKDVPKLRLKWAFGFPEAMSMYQQPSVFGGRIFVGSDSGYLYSIDAASGCVYWSYRAGAGMRSAVTVGLISPSTSRYAAFFGDVHGNAYAVDAWSGKLIWKVVAEAHSTARILGAPVLYGGNVYVAVTDLEEVAANSSNYLCCTGRGVLVALNARTGKQVWKTYTINEAARVVKTTSAKQVWGPSGAGIWNTPTIDPKRGAIYFGTGNGVTGSTDTSDAIFALDLVSGKVRWTFQATKSDVWHPGCPQGVPGEPNRPRGGRALLAPREDCVPVVTAPDWDFAASPMLVKADNGKEMLIAGQKSGSVWALDTNKRGAVLWKYTPPADQVRPAILFGGAADARSAYFNTRLSVFAINLIDGGATWSFPFPAPTGEMASHAGASAAVSAIPGVVFSAGLDGVLRAVSAPDGKMLWEYDTVHQYQTVNGVKAKGGSMGSGGTVVANGMVFVTSGYVGFQNGGPGNVLLAFAADK